MSLSLTYQKKSVLWIILVTLVFINLFFAYPSVLPLMLPIPDVKIITIIIIPIYVVILLSWKHVKEPSKLFLQAIIVQLFGWCLFFLIHGDSVYITRIIYLVNTFLVLLCVFQFKNGIVRIANYYVYFILFLSTTGTIAFLLVFFNILAPVSTYINADGRVGYYYILTCSNSPFLNFIRYSGIFDEPGAMAAWGIYALLLNRLCNFNSKIENLLLITLSFTLSMAFYIQAVIFIVLFKIRKLSHILTLIIVFFGLIAAIYNTKESEIGLYKLTFERFEKSADGSVKGDNRSSLAVIAKSYFSSRPLVGHGPTFIQEAEYMGDNPYETLASDGILGTFIIYFPFILLLYPLNKKIFYGIIILMIGYMQRPFHCHFIHPFMIYLFFLACINYKRHYFKNYETKNHCNYSIIQCRGCN